jgi:hypothetical protein
MIPMHYNTFRLGREPMHEPLPRLLRAATAARMADRVVPLAEGQSWIADTAGYENTAAFTASRSAAL